MIFRRKDKKNVKYSGFRELSEALIIAVIGALFIRAFIVQAYRIPTGSMEKTLMVGDFLLVNKLSYGAKIPFTDWRLPAYKEPKQGEIIVFKYPLDPSLDYIKRCIATGGQTIEIIDKKVYVDGKLFKDPPYSQFSRSRIIPKNNPGRNIFPPGSNFNKDNYGPFKVPEGHLFMMGDNRDNSLDSRFWGLVPIENVVGEALIIYWSTDYSVPIYSVINKVRWSRIANIIR